MTTMGFESKEPLEVTTGDAGGTLPLPVDLDGAGGSPVRPALADASTAVVGVCGRRFWALAGVDADEEDGIPLSRLGAPSSGVALGNFVLQAVAVGAGQGGQRWRFAPGGGGSRATAARLWRPPVSSDSGQQGAGSTTSPSVPGVGPLVSGSLEEWPSLPSLPSPVREAMSGVEEPAAALGLALQRDKPPALPTGPGCACWTSADLCRPAGPRAHAWFGGRWGWWGRG